ncbi:HXXEE domain-containing protein [Paenibacillus sp. FA6]|uniref:HXXEE domain-containing protein n=1 Tax=Paenibacillus sp. FA6 TaxID=3413029 RepID=UPI003F65C5EC
MILLDSFITIESFMWLFLAVFMIHDFEEIIFVESWMKRNYATIDKIIPKVARKLVKNMSEVKSSQFAVAVFMEFIVFIPITYLAVEQHHYVLFIGCNALMFVHVFTHLAQSLYLKLYTPGVLTALIVILPYSGYLFYRLIIEDIVTLKEILLYAPSGLIVLPLVLLGHKVGKLVIRN